MRVECLIFTLDFIRYQLEKEIITITRQSLILCIIIGESKEFLFTHHIYQTLLILFTITGYYSKPLIKVQFLVLCIIAGKYAYYQIFPICCNIYNIIDKIRKLKRLEIEIEIALNNTKKTIAFINTTN